MDLRINLLTTLISRPIRIFALWLILLFSLIPIEMLAQENRTSSLRCISKHVPSSTDISSFNFLSTELQPSIFVENGKLNSYGTNPLCLFTDIISLKNWPATLSSISDIQLIQLKISDVKDLQQPIDLSRFTEYTNLKFIYILSEIDTTESAVLEVLKNVPPNAIVFFTINKPS